MIRIQAHIHAFLFERCSIAPLVVFRVLWGFITFVSSARFVYLGWIDDQYILPKMHFAYYGFEWVHVLSPSGMYILYGLLMICSLGIMLGACYPVCAAVFFLTFTYIELIDVTYYLNHYYFVSLVSLMMVFVPANRLFSLDAYFFPSIKKNEVPAWTIRVFQLQLAIVYFYAGVAKIHYEWLIQAMPLKIWLPAHDDMPIIGSLLAYPVTAYVFSWMGMLYDLLVPFALFWRKTRVVAYAAVIGFHAITGYLFQIGVFPVVMIAATLIFFSPSFHQRILDTVGSWLGFASTSWAFTPGLTAPIPIWKTVLLLFFVFQILFPFRYLWYPGSLFWTEQGYRFSWRVMLMEKAGTATFFIKDKRGHFGVVNNADFLNAHQEKQMSFQPDMILQYAHFLHDYYSAHGISDPEVYAQIYVTLNGRPSRLYVDTTVNLANVYDSWSHKNWILPLEE